VTASSPLSNFPAPELTVLFRDRLRRAFAAVGSMPIIIACFCRDGCRPLSRRDRASDIVLDSIGWSGCNSLLDALPTDLPS